MMRKSDPWNEDGEFGLTEALSFLLFTVGMAGLAYVIGWGLLSL